MLKNFFPSVIYLFSVFVQLLVGIWKWAVVGTMPTQFGFGEIPIVSNG